MKELQELINEILTLRNYGVINKEEEKSLLTKLNSVKEQFAICGVSNCNCDNGNDFFEEQYVLQHLVNDTWQVVGEKTNTVWKQGTKEICEEWLDL